MMLAKMFVTNGAVLLLVLRFISSTICCPHEDATLKKFSETYGSYDKSSDIVITDNVLLDVSLLDVNTVEVTGTGKLVFNQGHDITVKVKGIYVRDSASLIIGSELCRHTDDVKIVLQGTRTANRAQLGGEGEKYIAVTDQGTLHIYGEERLAWTKLSKTIPANTYSGPYEYRHMTSSVSYWYRWYEGLSLYVFNAALQKKIFVVYDFTTEDPADEVVNVNNMIDQLDIIADGDVVAISVKNRVNPGPGTSLTALYDKIETLAGMDAGSLLMRSAAEYDAFSLVFVKGGSFVQDRTDSSRYSAPARAEASLTYQGRRVTAESIVYYKKHYISTIDVRISTPEVDYPEIQVVGDVSSWRVGDKILLTSTDYAWNHAETRKIVEVTGPHTLKISDEPTFRHFGEFEHGVDMRGEVALLSRNVKIEGEMSRHCHRSPYYKPFEINRTLLYSTNKGYNTATCGHCPESNENCVKIPYDSYGGHVKIIAGFNSVVIDGAELEHMGQATDMGFYPIHFHMCLDVTDKKALVRQNSIHDTFSRAVTVHGTYGTSPSQPGVEVEDNVAYRIRGQAYFEEDGIEKGTTFIGNLVAWVLNIENFFGADKRQSSGFWITTPETVLIGNVAAGGEGFGFWYIFPANPVGPSAGMVYEDGEIWRTPLWTCDSNVAHSNMKNGMMFDHVVADNVGTIDGSLRYSAKTDTKDPNSGTVKIQMVRFTGYKNKNFNFWARAGELEVIQISSAESETGLQFATGTPATQKVRKGIFVGKSEANGEGPDYPDSAGVTYHQGVAYYDGPVYFESCWFTNFANGPNRSYVSGAIGFEVQNKFLSAPASHAKDLRFSFVDGVEGNRVFDGSPDDTDVGFGNKNGDEAAIFRDMDGSVTRCPGDDTWQAPETVVKPEKFIITANCSYRENWQMAVCTDMFGKARFYAREIWSGTIYDYGSGQTRRIRYDDPTSMAYEDTFREAVSASEYVTVLGDDTYYYEHQFLPKMPKKLEIRGAGIHKNYPVVVGVCMPEDATREDLTISGFVSGGYFVDADAVQVNSLQELSESEFFNRFYISGRMFYTKLQNKRTRDPAWDKYDLDECPGGSCPVVTVKFSREMAYTPCFTPTEEELNTDVYVPDDMPRSTCQFTETRQPESDWGAGDSLQRSRDGNWGEWSGWQDCCNANGVVSQTRRFRVCDNPPVMGSGQECKGTSEEMGDCQTGCPVNGEWTAWTSWSDCMCDGVAAGTRGVKSMTRECLGTANGGSYCWGSTNWFADCNGDCDHI